MDSICWRVNDATSQFGTLLIQAIGDSSLQPSVKSIDFAAIPVEEDSGSPAGDIDLIRGK